MTLASGVRLGPYEILALAGAGGMGEVYRARDTRLDRTVAIKVLAESVSADAPRRARFEREARAIAALNHPHICALYDVGEAPGPSRSSAGDGIVRFIVLEFLDGQTLASRLAAGPVPLTEALRHAIDIGDALDKAHRLGVVHRDLKPANVMLTKAGAKLLDFGLATSVAPVAGTSTDAMHPATPANLTVEGTVLGTVQYMAPEQVEGLQSDPRTDVFAFGALLFEMLTGRPAFEGRTRASLLTAILRDEPPLISQFQPAVPPALARIVSTCLAKDPDDRYQSTRDLVRELEWVAAETGAGRVSLPVNMPARPRPATWAIAALSIAAVVVVAMFAAGRWRRTADNPPFATAAVQFTIAAPDQTSFGGPADAGTGTAAQLAVSPDGQTIAFVAGDRPLVSGATTAYRLWLRPVGTLTARPIPGSEGAAFPFWSPDGRSMAFFAGGKLKKVAIAGGPPIALAEAPSGRGGSWSRDNVILFAPARNLSGLLRVSADGGSPTVVTNLDPATGEVNHRWPHFLPDGRHFIYTGVSGPCCPALTPSRIRVASLDAGSTATTLFQGESAVAYAAGHLIFARDETLMAQPFDVNTLQLKEDAFPLAEHIGPEGSRYLAVSVSERGTLVYSQSVSSNTEHVAWVDRAGRSLAAVPEADRSVNFALSADNDHLAITLGTGTLEDREISILDLTRGVRSPIVVEPGVNEAPVWSPDGTRIAYGRRRSGKGSLHLRTINGTAADEMLVEGAGSIMPSSWSKDGRFIAYTLAGPLPSTSEVWIVPVDGARTASRLRHTGVAAASAAFAPDGHWIAYTADEGGRLNVFVQSFPTVDARYQVSKDGGSHPFWRADGKELYYLAPDQTLVAVPIDVGVSFAARAPEVLFQTSAPRFNTGQVYAVTNDGQRFLTTARPARPAPTPLTVVLNWTGTIRR